MNETQKVTRGYLDCRQRFISRCYPESVVDRSLIDLNCQNLELLHHAYSIALQVDRLVGIKGGDKIWYARYGKLRSTIETSRKLKEEFVAFVVEMVAKGDELVAIPSEL